MRSGLRMGAIGAVALTALAGVAAVAALSWAAKRAHAQNRQPWGGMVRLGNNAGGGGGAVGEGDESDEGRAGEGDAALSRVQREGDPFLPSKHGFAFINHFTGSSLPPELRDAEGGLLLWARNVAETYADLPEEFGLCGGMSLFAADHYAAGAAMPAAESAPEQGTGLYDAIYARQRDSLGGGARYVLKFAQWMALPDIGPGETEAALTLALGDAPIEAAGGAIEGAEGGASEDERWAERYAAAESTSALTRLELPAICRALERGELVPLGLVLTRAGRGNLWNNHQVLGYRLERVDDATLHMFIYDPNYPGDDRCFLRVEGIGMGLMGLDAEDDSVAIASLRAGEPGTSGAMVRTTRLTGSGQARAVRGVFPMPWEPVRAKPAE